MKDIAILSSVRTPMGKGYKGSLKDTRPDTFAAVVVKEAVKRAGVKPEQVDDLIMGCAMPEAQQGMNVARTIALLAGLPNSTSAATINRFCSSGLHAIADIAKSIEVGQVEIGDGGGVESMTMVPMGGFHPSANPELMESLPEAYVPMGLTADNVAKKFGITREVQDQFAFQSHQRALNAIQAGYFKDEIVGFDVSIFDANGMKQTKHFDTDEGPRADTSAEVLAKLKPAFDAKGTVTAGNASQITDGAAAAVLMEKSQAESQKLPIMGYFRAFVTAGVPPELMGIGPVPAIQKLLKHTGMKKDDIGVFEINEAFAAQATYCIQELGLDPNIVNPCGGAIALGHPLGCTGARQVATILRELKRNKQRYGVCAMCIGGGMGAAALIEAV
ncbi:MAG: thiolase family protein [Deltaproteobacteria bacterium]|nr:thiolase family protein [Deltaproteobacteria bacterium]